MPVCQCRVGWAWVLRGRRVSRRARPCARSGSFGRVGWVCGQQFDGLLDELGVAAVLCCRRILACDEWVEHGNAGWLEVPHVAGDHGQSVLQGRCGNRAGRRRCGPGWPRGGPSGRRWARRGRVAGRQKPARVRSSQAASSRAKFGPWKSFPGDSPFNLGDGHDAHVQVRWPLVRARRLARGGGPGSAGRRPRWCRAGTSPGHVAKVQRRAIEQVVRPAFGDGREVLNEVGRAGFLRRHEPLVVSDSNDDHGGLATAGYVLRFAGSERKAFTTALNLFLASCKRQWARDPPC